MVVLVTGCRSGIGLQTALAFARRGDRVYAGLRDGSSCPELSEQIARQQLPIVVMPLDVTDASATRCAVDHIIENEGRLDVLVNNAGIAGTAAAIEEIDEAVARSVWETNFWAPFRLIREVLPHMRARGSGVIVNVSTFAVRFPGGPGLAMYATSKTALSRLSECLHTELEGTGVRVVAIEPGFFNTDIYRDEIRPVIDSSSPYAALIADVDECVAAGITGGADPAVVANAILAAVDDPPKSTCVLVGKDAIAAVDEHHRELIAAWEKELGRR